MQRKAFVYDIPEDDGNGGGADTGYSVARKRSRSRLKASGKGSVNALQLDGETPTAAAQTAKLVPTSSLANATSGDKAHTISIEAELGKWDDADFDNFFQASPYQPQPTFMTMTMEGEGEHDGDGVSLQPKDKDRDTVSVSGFSDKAMEAERKREQGRDQHQDGRNKSKDKGTGTAIDVNQSQPHTVEHNHNHNRTEYAFELTESNARMAELRAEIDALRNAQFAKDGEIKILRERLKGEESAKLALARQRLDDATRFKHDKDAALAELKRELRGVRSELQFNRQELQEKEFSCNVLREEIRETSDARLAAETDLAEREMAVKRASDRIDELERALKSTKYEEGEREGEGESGLDKSKVKSKPKPKDGSEGESEGEGDMEDSDGDVSISATATPISQPLAFTLDGLDHVSPGGQLQLRHGEHTSTSTHMHMHVHTPVTTPRMQRALNSNLNRGRGVNVKDGKTRTRGKVERVEVKGGGEGEGGFAQNKHRMLLSLLLSSSVGDLITLLGDDSLHAAEFSASLINIISPSGGDVESGLAVDVSALIPKLVNIAAIRSSPSASASPSKGVGVSRHAIACSALRLLHRLLSFDSEHCNVVVPCEGEGGGEGEGEGEGEGVVRVNNVSYKPHITSAGHSVHSNILVPVTGDGDGGGVRGRGGVKRPRAFVSKGGVSDGDGDGGNLFDCIVSMLARHENGDTEICAILLRIISLCTLHCSPSAVPRVVLPHLPQLKLKHWIKLTDGSSSVGSSGSNSGRECVVSALGTVKGVCRDVECMKYLLRDSSAVAEKGKGKGNGNGLSTIDTVVSCFNNSDPAIATHSIHTIYYLSLYHSTLPSVLYNMKDGIFTRLVPRLVIYIDNALTTTSTSTPTPTWTVIDALRLLILLLEDGDGELLHLKQFIQKMKFDCLRICEKLSVYSHSDAHVTSLSLRLSRLLE